MIKLESADLVSIFCNGGPEKTLKVEYDRSPRYSNAETTAQHSPPSLSYPAYADREFSGSRLVRMKHFASLFSMSMKRHMAVSVGKDTKSL